MLEDSLRAIIVRYAERLDEGGMNFIEQPLPLGGRPSLNDLDSD